jgi:A/G-specific adenine glycosylase
MTGIGELLILWYNGHKRGLPWRETNDPYHVWVSEVILQQTRVDQGLGYYHRFIDIFPDIKTLADAPADQVLRAWQGLGYYRRAQNLHKAARVVQEMHQGVLPLTWAELRKLPGIGDYTAGAIASICAGERVPAIDGNVKRVISRLHNLNFSLDNPAGLKLLKTLALDIMEGEDPGTMNNALMEFGALQCTPANPDCERCPLAAHCMALIAGTAGELPVKPLRKPLRKRHFHYLVFTWQESGALGMLVRKRGDKDIWAGMYEFPYIETNDTENGDQVFIPDPEMWCRLPEGTEARSTTAPYQHQLTHQLIVARFYHYSLPGSPEDHHPDLIRVTQDGFRELARPRLILKYLEDSFISL